MDTLEHFARMPGSYHCRLSQKEYGELLLQSPFMACGHLWELRGKSVGAGVYEVRAYPQPWPPEEEMKKRELTDLRAKLERYEKALDEISICADISHVDTHEMHNCLCEIMRIARCAREGK